MASAAPIGLFFFLVLFCARLHVGVSFTNSEDAAALKSLKNSWLNTPPSWHQSDDPCGFPWDGVTCKNTRVISLGLPSMGLKGGLSGDIGGLIELRSLDLSNNKELTGSLTARLGDLKNLNFLILQGCGFTGNIPSELGNLAELTFLALNTNNLSGRIPPSLGKLANLYWLDLAENQLTGPLPVSTRTTPGLDQLHKAKHFHFNENQLSGSIPAQLFSSDMELIHVLFDSNKLTGRIPETIGLVQTLEVLRLDRNSLSGAIPSNISNLTHISELHLAQNELSGTVPDLSTMTALNYLDLSNNSFLASEAPAWFTSLSSLNTLVMEYSSLQGSVPQELLTFPLMQVVKLRNNAFDGPLTIGGASFSSRLQLVDLENNRISSVTLGSDISGTLILIGNPVCDNAIANTVYCGLQLPARPYSTSLASCGDQTCPDDQKLIPKNCECAYPFEGRMNFRAPLFRDLTNVSLFHSLEMSLWMNLSLTPGFVYLQNLVVTIDDHLQVQVALFPPSGLHFNRTEVIRIGYDLNSQVYKPPHGFGPYIFISSSYPFPVKHHGTSISTGVIVGTAIGCLILVLGLIGVGIYAYRQRKRADKAVLLSKPFASWEPSGDDNGGAPQLKGARWFSYDELKKCTGNFSGTNEIGSGGYGKVYRGMLSDGQIVAIKRAQQGSMQGGLEFKTEIELLSRVHHKNLVSLVGFCFEQGEQMMVYDFIANGNLRESLSGKSGIYLDWKRRLRIALGSARGLTYLHELADPPIIHRDVKSTNILLDETLTAKVADFGLSKLISDAAKGHVSTQVKGTMGYLDPEYYMTQQLTDKSDVYSFGVVMLELVTARQPIDKGKYIVREVRMAMNKTDEDYYGLKELIDPTIINAGHLFGFVKFLDLAMQCVEESAANRPTMCEMVKYIETILESDGIATNATSAASSATEFGVTKGSHKHPYNDMPRKDVGDSDSFDYSGGYAFSTKVEPK